MKRVIETRPVGDVFTQDGREYVVTECDRGCLACDMYDGAPDNLCGADIAVCGLCVKQLRSDGKDVVFRRKEEQP